MRLTHELVKDLRDTAQDIKTLRQGLGARSSFLKAAEDLMREAANALEDANKEFLKARDDASRLRYPEGQ